MADRLRPLLVALSLAGTAPALAYEAPSPQSGEPACSALCRSWMDLGSAAAEPQPASPEAERPAAPPAPVPSPKARPPVSGARAADAPRRSGRTAVPLPPARPASAIAELPRAAVAVTAPVAQTTTALAEARPPAPSANGTAPSPVATPSVVDGPQPPPTPAAAPPIAPAEDRPLRAVASPVPEPKDPGAPAGTSLEARSHGTPWSLRLGVYAVLAGMVCWGFRPRRDATPADGSPNGPVRQRRSARGREIGLQDAAVDAL